MNVHIEIKNAAQIQAAFRKAPYLMTKNLSKAIKNVSYKVQGESMKITPVRTGFLRGSHRTTFQGALHGTVEPTASYAYFVHEGTRFMRKRPFLENAVEFSQGFTDAEMELAVQDTLDSIARAT